MQLDAHKIKHVNQYKHGFKPANGP